MFDLGLRLTWLNVWLQDWSWPGLTFDFRIDLDLAWHMTSGLTLTWLDIWLQDWPWPSLTFDCRIDLDLAWHLTAGLTLRSPRASWWRWWGRWGQASPPWCRPSWERWRSWRELSLCRSLPHTYSFSHALLSLVDVGGGGLKCVCVGGGTIQSCTPFLCWWKTDWSVCVHVCVRERDQRERESSCVREHVCVSERERECACVCMLEHECVCVCVCVHVRERERVCVCVRERVRVCVCVCERERERVCVCVRELVCVCERERECVCLYVRERMCVCVCTCAAVVSHKRNVMFIFYPGYLETVFLWSCTSILFTEQHRIRAPASLDPEPDAEKQHSVRQRVQCAQVQQSHWSLCPTYWPWHSAWWGHDRDWRKGQTYNNDTGNKWDLKGQTYNNNNKWDLKGQTYNNNNDNKWDLKGQPYNNNNKNNKWDSFGIPSSRRGSAESFEIHTSNT